MAYIVGLIVFAFLFIALHYFTELTKSQKTVITAILFVVIAGAILYNRYSDQERENMMQVVTKFRQNKSVTCKDVEVNSSNYTLSIGTFTFIGKENTPVYGQMISASTCQ